jgi:hypothetical protein
MNPQDTNNETPRAVDSDDDDDTAMDCGQAYQCSVPARYRAMGNQAACHMDRYNRAACIPAHNASGVDTKESKRLPAGASDLSQPSYYESNAKRLIQEGEDSINEERQHELDRINSAAIDPNGQDLNPISVVATTLHHSKWIDTTGPPACE